MRGKDKAKRVVKLTMLDKFKVVMLVNKMIADRGCSLAVATSAYVTTNRSHKRHSAELISDGWCIDIKQTFDKPLLQRAWI